MSLSKHFHVFHGRDDFSSDQLALIAREVKTRQHILDQALENLENAISSSRRVLKYGPGKQEKSAKIPVSKQILQKPSRTSAAKQPKTKALKGKVSYKVKGPGGRLMNIAEIKAWVNSLYDGEQGIIKQ